MQLLNMHVGIEQWTKRIASAPQRVLMLDYDGTLAPFRIERDQAVPYPGVRDLLSEIIAGGRTRLVIISGRAIHDLLPLMLLEPAPEIWGTHGWEHRYPNGQEATLVLPAGAAEGFSAATHWVEQQGLDEHLEHKPASRALHWRGMSDTCIDELRVAVQAAWEPLASTYNLTLKPFDGGFELSVPGRDKGYAVGEVLRETPQDAAIAFLGDDRTDEDGFRVLQERGLSVLVRTELKETAADLWITPPDELLEFLRLWR